MLLSIFLIVIAIAYYYDYKRDKKHFKLTIQNMAYLLLVVVAIIILWYIIF